MNQDQALNSHDASQSYKFCEKTYWKYKTNSYFKDYPVDYIEYDDSHKKYDIKHMRKDGESDNEDQSCCWSLANLSIEPYEENEPDNQPEFRNNPKFSIDYSGESVEKLDDSNIRADTSSNNTKYKEGSIQISNYENTNIDSGKHNQEDESKIIAMDCEMVGVGHDGSRNIVARVSIVSWDGKVVLDTYVAPTEPVTDYRTHISGVKRENLVNAPDFKNVQELVQNIKQGKVIVGHSVQNDLNVLGLSHPSISIRDTAKFVPLRPHYAINRMPSLRNLSKRILDKTIQNGEHDSVEDATSALQIYQKFQGLWEDWIHGPKFPL